MKLALHRIACFLGLHYWGDWRVKEERNEYIYDSYNRHKSIYPPGSQEDIQTRIHSMIGKVNVLIQSRTCLSCKKIQINKQETMA